MIPLMDMDHPEEVIMPRKWLWFGFAIISLIHFATAAALPLVEDEIYYWCWSKDVQFSYYDHPPMTAYMIRLSTSVFGDNRIGVRFFACVSSLAAFLIISWITKNRWIILGMLLTPTFLLGGILMTPDAPLILFWSGYLAWLIDAHRKLSENKNPTWIWGGVILGLGILSKYTTGVAIPAAFLSLVTIRPWSRWFRGFAIQMVIAFIISSPILIHNIRFHFEPLRYQWTHTMAPDDPWSPLYFPEFVGVQVLLVGWLPFTLLPWAIYHYRRLRLDPKLHASFWLFAFPSAFFLYKGATGPLEANWPIACYLGCGPILAFWAKDWVTERFAKRTIMAGFLIPTISMTFLCWHLLMPVPFLPTRSDRLHRFVGNGIAFAKIGEAIKELPNPEEAIVYAPSYQWTARLRYHGIPAEQIQGITRPSEFTFHGKPLQDQANVLVVSDGFLPAAKVSDFEPPEVVEEIPLMVRGERNGGYYIFRYRQKDLRTAKNLQLESETK